MKNILYPLILVALVMGIIAFVMVMRPWKASAWNQECYEDCVEDVEYEDLGNRSYMEEWYHNEFRQELRKKISK